jgi:glycine/D-amino acid oxidase-like deaminating enzyme
MKILVLGAGVIGVTTTWFLSKSGHEVTVVDRQAAPGLETSFANGGQISVSHAEPWANPSAPLKVLKWLAREDAPLLFRLRPDIRQWLWGLAFLRECTRARSRRNIEQIVTLAGTAELNGYNTELDPTRCRALLRRTEQLFPGAGDAARAQFWAGLRPATPSNVPYIGGHALPEPVPQHRPRHARVDACLRQRSRAGGHSVWPAAGNRFRLLRRTRRTSRGRTKAGNSARGRCLSRRSSRR